MADTSLWSVVVGGLLTLSGIGVGLVGTARRDAAQERRDAKKRREEKFEELVAAAYEVDHWIGSLRDRHVFGIENISDTVSPLVKVQSISAVHFPQFDKLIDKLSTAEMQVSSWIYHTRHTRLLNNTVMTPIPEGFEQVIRPYEQKHKALLDALKNFAHEHFQSPIGPT